MIVEEEGAVLGVNFGHPIVTNGGLRRRSSQITLGRTCFRSDAGQTARRQTDRQTDATTVSYRSLSHLQSANLIMH